MSETPTQSPVDQNALRIWVIAGIVGVAVGWFAATSPVSPIRPQPEPDRPVLRLLARLAKLGLYVMWVADPPPQMPQYVHARVDQDGHPVLNHSEGW